MDLSIFAWFVIKHQHPTPTSTQQQHPHTKIHPHTPKSTTPFLWKKILIVFMSVFFFFFWWYFVLISTLFFFNNNFLIFIVQQLCEGGFTPHSLIQLLKENITYPPIRQFAAESLQSCLIPGNLKEFRLYLPILVEMLRYEALPDPSPLFNTILEASVFDPEIRYDFFWAMNLRACFWFTICWKIRFFKNNNFWFLWLPDVVKKLCCN